MERIAVFDFDGTIKKHDSFLSFLLTVTHNNTLELCRSLFPFVIPILLVKMNFISAGRIKEKIYKSFLKNIPQKEFIELCVGYSTIINNDLNQAVIEKIKQHQNNGDKVVILSASLAEMIRPWAKSLGIDDVVATEIEWNDKGFFKCFSTPNCNGNEKPVRLQHYLKSCHEYHLTGYGDSKADHPFLSICNTSYIISHKKHEIRLFK